MLRKTLPKSLRLRTKRDFLSFIKDKKKFKSSFLSIEFRPKTSHLRLGISIPRSYGKAHRRNLFRRRVKEVFRLLQHELPCVWLHIRPKIGIEPTFWQIQQDFKDFIDANPVDSSQKREPQEVLSDPS